MNPKTRDRLVYFLFSLIAVIAIVGYVGAWEGETNTLSPGFHELDSLNLSTGIFYDSDNRTDTLANPQGPYQYVIWISGGTTYARNGATGQIDYSGSNESLVIQDAWDNSDGSIRVKKGTYTLDVGITAPDDNTEISFEPGVIISFDGSGYALTLGGTGALRIGAKITGYPRIELGSTPDGAVLIEDAVSCVVKLGTVKGPSVVSGQVGVELGETGQGCYENHVWILDFFNLDTVVNITAGANANTIHAYARASASYTLGVDVYSHTNKIYLDAASGTHGIKFDSAAAQNRANVYFEGSGTAVWFNGTSANNYVLLQYMAGTVSYPNPPTGGNVIYVLNDGYRGLVEFSSQGSSGGILIGDDVQLYRGAADTLTIPDTVILDLGSDLTGFRVEPNADAQTSVGYGIVNAAGSTWVWMVRKDGQMWFNEDTNLYRSAANTLKTDDAFISATRIIFDDGSDNIKIESSATNPTIQFGETGSYDTNLYRSSSNVLATDDAFNVGGAITWGGDTNIYRAGANALKTDDEFNIGTTSITANGFASITAPANTQAIIKINSGTLSDAYPPTVQYFLGGTGYSELRYIQSTDSLEILDYGVGPAFKFFIGNSTMTPNTNNTGAIGTDLTRFANIWGVTITGKSMVTGAVYENEISPRPGETFEVGDLIKVYDENYFTKTTENLDYVIGVVDKNPAQVITGYDTTWKIVEETIQVNETYTETIGVNRTIETPVLGWDGTYSAKVGGKGLIKISEPVIKNDIIVAGPNGIGRPLRTVIQELKNQYSGANLNWNNVLTVMEIFSLRTLGYVMDDSSGPFCWVMLW